MSPSVMQTGAALEPVRFGEFLRDRAVISEEQWLAALALHWSSRGTRVGDAIIAQGFLSDSQVEAEARVFHEDLDIVEVGPELGSDVGPSFAAEIDVDAASTRTMRSARITAPITRPKHRS